MHCHKCGSFSTVLVSQINLGGMIQETWNCKMCNWDSFRAVPMGQPASGQPATSPAQPPPFVFTTPPFPVTVASITSAMQANDPALGQAKTRQEKINAFWDIAIASLEKMTPLEQEMLYFSMYQRGMRIDGLAYKIDGQIFKKFPKEEKQK